MSIFKKGLVEILTDNRWNLENGHYLDVVPEILNLFLQYLDQKLSNKMDRLQIEKEVFETRTEDINIEQYAINEFVQELKESLK